LRGPVEPGQYTAEDYTQVLDDHRVLASVGSVGDAYDNALAESFVDSYNQVGDHRGISVRSRLESAEAAFLNASLFDQACPA
jgi:transposase InsO family protein